METARSGQESPVALGAVLAGGSSSRMGAPKAMVELGGRTLVEYPLAALGAAGLDSVVMAKSRTGLPRLETRVWIEPSRPTHPLCGILAALRQATRPVLVVGCDLPFVSSELLSWLAAMPDRLVVPDIGGRLHPLLARYDPSLEPALARALKGAEPLQRTVAGLGPRRVGEGAIARFGAPERLLFNVNTPEDLAQAERMLDH